jgi:segregation and condensation protein B
MSLKAKLEAVIYAAEEPVTLAQLAILFADEALEWKAEQEAASAPQPFLGEEFAQLDPRANPDLGQEPALAEGADLESDSEPIAAESLAEPESEAALEAEAAEIDAILIANPDAAELLLGPAEVAEISQEAAPPVQAEAAPDAELPAELSAETELELKRQARLRDREVRGILRQILDEIIADYAADGRGVEIREIAGGYRMATKPECHDAVRLFIKSLKPALRLSLPALETLAVIAYKQPVTAPEVNEIRGVDSSAVFGTLLARKLISTAGRKPVIGRPILYKTTREFLLRFGLKDVAELPSMEEFEKLAATELDEPEPSNEEKLAQRPNPALGPEFEEAGHVELEDSPDDALKAETETPEHTETAETAACNETAPDEAAPAAPPTPEQAENETSPYDEAQGKPQNQPQD